jgi:hypothetical protein
MILSNQGIVHELEICENKYQMNVKMVKGTSATVMLN